VTPYAGDNPLYQHGPVRVAADGATSSMPTDAVLWLADTWWMGFCARLDWPRGFQSLALDRVEKGFNVVQIVAGLYPTCPTSTSAPRTKRVRVGTGVQGDQPGLLRLRGPAHRLYGRGCLMPCIVGCWGYFLTIMGVAKAKQHWRYLVARYGAYPVFWCLAGEQTMPSTSPPTRRPTRLARRRAGAR